MTRTTDSLRVRMDMAAERAEAEKASLCRPDGSRVYGEEEEHAERTAAIAEGVARVADEVRAGTDRNVEEKRAALDAILYADPTEDLTAEEELERANARAPFVREDCETLEPDGLAGRIRGVLAGGDKATAWVYRSDAVPALKRRLRDPAKERRRQSAEKDLAAAERARADQRARMRSAF